ncbi:hypothetical protein B296_00014429 [Ensete ventricosum]|uniref:Uncharacterized protein n=1 Tax=Ensete ventricosum TaxID=4639 RepID=A0A426XE74_ENSVE|nr:hypothetical protein B296_00014429 [Ensete ventricosum]
MRKQRSGEAAGAEAMVVGGTTEKGRMISPPKDDNERPQEGVTCGRWGGVAVADGLPRKIGDGDNNDRVGEEEVCLLVAAGGSRCRRCANDSWGRVGSSGGGGRSSLYGRSSLIMVSFDNKKRKNSLYYGSNTMIEIKGDCISLYFQIQMERMKEVKRLPL